MSFASEISNIVFNITLRNPSRVFNNSPKGKEHPNRTIKLSDLTLSPKELRDVETAMRFAYPYRFVRVRNMKSIGNVCDEKVVITFNC